MRSTSVLHNLNDNLATVAAQTRQGLVQVRSGRRGGGTGIVVGAGLVVTNAHVVHGRRPNVAFADGRQAPAEVAAYDADLDLAALVVSLDHEHLAAPTLGTSSTLKPGDWVMGVGHPWGVVGAATVGVVARTGRSWARGPLKGHEWVTADLHLRPGHSGGALVDATGAVVGINTMVLSPNLGVAVPVDTVRRFLLQVRPSSQKK